MHWRSISDLASSSQSSYTPGSRSPRYSAIGRGGVQQDPVVVTGRRGRQGRLPLRSKTRTSTRHVVVSCQHRSLGVTTSDGSSPSTWRRWCSSRRRLVSACASVDSGQKQPAMRCRGCGDPACMTRKATRTSARDDRARTLPARSSVIACSPNTDTRSMRTWPPDVCAHGLLMCQITTARCDRPVPVLIERQDGVIRRVRSRPVSTPRFVRLPLLNPSSARTGSGLVRCRKETGPTLGTADMPAQKARKVRSPRAVQARAPIVPQVAMRQVPEVEGKPDAYAVADP